MSVTEQITGKNHSHIIEMLSNVPKPSGDGHTKTLDYDRKIVCQLPVSNARFIEQDAKQNTSIKTICTSVGDSLIEGATVVGFFSGGITIGGSFVVCASTATAPVNREALILKSLENWIPKNAVKLSSSKFEVTDEILRFCFNHNIVKYLQPIMNLIKESFPSFQEPYLEIEKDPECDREWLVFDIDVNGDIKEVLECYNNYTTRFVSIVPWPEREKFRLSYNII